jgi:hypothetical protein
MLVVVQDLVTNNSKALGIAPVQSNNFTEHS